MAELDNGPSRPLCRFTPLILLLLSSRGMALQAIWRSGSSLILMPTPSSCSTQILRSQKPCESSRVTPPLWYFTCTRSEGSDHHQRSSAKDVKRKVRIQLASCQTCLTSDNKISFSSCQLLATHVFFVFVFDRYCNNSYAMQSGWRRARSPKTSLWIIMGVLVFFQQGPISQPRMERQGTVLAVD